MTGENLTYPEPILPYQEMDEDHWYWFEKFMGKYHPVTPNELDDAVRADDHRTEVRENWEDWEEIARRDLPNATAEDLVDAFSVEVTIDAASKYADVHPAHAFGEYMRNREDIADSRNLPYASHDCSQVSNEDRLEVLECLHDDYSKEDIADKIDKQSTEELVDHYRTHR